MAPIKIQQFGGMLPAWDDHLLPGGQASSATNGYLFGGKLGGWRQPKLLRTLTNPSAKYAYRIPTDIIAGRANHITDPTTWLEFADPDTNVLKSQVVNEVFGRYYFASPSQVPQYNTLNRIQTGKPAFNLGIPVPACPPTVTVEGGGNTATLPNVNTNSNGHIANLTANTVYLVPIIPNGTLSLADVQFVPQTTDPLANFVAVLYADASDNTSVPTQPGHLIAVGDIINSVTAGTATLSPFANPPPLLAHVPYWIGIMCDTTITISEGIGNSTSYSFSNVFSNGPSDPAGSGSGNQIDFQMWGDFNTSDVIEPRAYTYTWVSAYGEEGPPAEPVIVNGWSNGTWTIGLYQPPSDQLGVTHNLAILRLYRSVPGTSGSTVFYFVADISLGSSDPDAINAVQTDPVGCFPPSETYIDNVLDNVIALNAQLPSTNYIPPPTDLQGLVDLPNGMMVGWRANEIWFCEPYLPHAWPAQYVMTTEFPIVGMAATGGAVVVCTGANAYVCSGSAPNNMALVKCLPAQPCLSRGSIIGTQNGVYYQSPNGLIMVNQGNTLLNTTETWITRERWQALTPQKYGRATPIVGCYLCFGTTFPGDNSLAQTGFVIQMEPDAASFSIWPQPGGHRVGFEQLTSPNGFNIDNVLHDPWTGTVLLIQNGGVYYYDFSDQAPTITPYTWRSKKYQQGAKTNFGAMKVFFTVPPGSPDPTTVARNEADKTDPSWNTLSPTQYGILRVYADVDDGSGDGAMHLVTCREIRRNGELLRIESGFKAETWQFEVTGRVDISNIQIAASAKELANV